MQFNSKIEKITIVDNGLLVFYNTGTQKELLFSELKDVFITVRRIDPIDKLLIIMFSAIVALFIFFNPQANLILIISSLLIVLIILKMKNYKRYVMIINLKNGMSIKNKIPLKSKNDAVNFVNDVRKKAYNNKIENTNKLGNNIQIKHPTIAPKKGMLILSKLYR